MLFVVHVEKDESGKFCFRKAFVVSLLRRHSLSETMMSRVKTWVRELYPESSSWMLFCNSLFWILYIVINNSDTGIENIFIKSAADAKPGGVTHTFKDRIRNQDGFHELKK